jgi:hypothetical protein
MKITYFYVSLNKSTLVISLSILLIFTACLSKQKDLNGKELAEKYCTTCHLFPSPSILPSRTWENEVLPNMGPRLGMTYHGPTYYDFSYNNMPEMMDQQDWEKIVLYYRDSSETEIPYPITSTLEPNHLFNPTIFSYDSVPSSLITMISFDNHNENVLIGDGKTSSLVTLDINGNILKNEDQESPPVQVTIKDTLTYVLTIGSLDPSDEATGILHINNESIDSLRRPVNFIIKDINQDDYDDLLICNFGNTIGDLSWYKNLKNGSYLKKVIHPFPGAIKVDFTNMDDDDESEIIALFAQEHEKIMIWKLKNNVFIEKKVLQFHPGFGFVDFQLKDIDNDGDKDIITCNGDNADYSQVLKNYHGVRIFLNMGDMNFQETYFHPIHGGSKLEVEDFDLDGNLDILVISNFGNLKNENFKSVHYLRNDGHMQFKTQYIHNLPNYRWQTMNVSDFDKDGDLDVFIGGFHLNIGPPESNITNENNISWVKLENNTL